MRRLLLASTLAFGVLWTFGPAYACPMWVPPDFEDVRYADTVVLGRPLNYAIVQGKVSYHREYPPGSVSEASKVVTRGPFEDKYARFEVVVDKVLAGKAGKNLSVVWTHSTFGEPPTIAAGQYLIALRAPNSSLKSLDGKRTFESEPDAMIVLQKPCSSAFFFESSSEEAAAVRAVLRRKSPIRH